MFYIVIFVTQIFAIKILCLHSTYIQSLEIKISAEIIVRICVAKTQMVSWVWTMGAHMKNIYHALYLSTWCYKLYCIISHIFTYLDFGENWLKTCLDILIFLNIFLAICSICFKVCTFAHMHTLILCFKRNFFSIALGQDLNVIIFQQLHLPFEIIITNSNTWN